MYIMCINWLGAMRYELRPADEGPTDIPVHAYSVSRSCLQCLTGDRITATSIWMATASESAHQNKNMDIR